MLWMVLTCISLTAGQNSFIRDFISLAALFVKVTESMFLGLTPFSRRYRIFAVRHLVLPDPAEAET